MKKCFKCKTPLFNEKDTKKYTCKKESCSKKGKCFIIFEFNELDWAFGRGEFSKENIEKRWKETEEKIRKLGREYRQKEQELLLKVIVGS